VKLRNPARDRQTEAGAVRLAFTVVGSRVVGAEKTIENLVLCAGGNAAAVIADANDILRVVAARVNAHPATRLAELDRVVREIEQHPPKQLSVASHRHRAVGVAAQRDAVRLRDPIERVSGIADDLLQLHAGHLDCALLSSTACEEQHALEQIRQM